MTDRTEYIGADLSGKGDDLFVMHNHSRNSGFSHQDVFEFFNTDAIKKQSMNGRKRHEHFDLKIFWR